MSIMLSNESTEEDVVKFFVEKCNIKEDIQNKLKSENITGEILPLLTQKDFKDSLGLKFGDKKNGKYIITEIKINLLQKKEKKQLHQIPKRKKSRAFLRDVFLLKVI